MQEIRQTAEAVNRIKAIEAAAYAGTAYAQMQNCHSWDDIADYCESDREHIHCYGGGNGENGFYLLWAEHEEHIEIVDLAKTGEVPGRRIAAAVLQVLQDCSRLNKPAVLDSREGTSYPFLQTLIEKGRLTAMEDEVYAWGGETFHKMRLVVVKEKEHDQTDQETGAIEVDCEYERE